MKEDAKLMSNKFSKMRQLIVIMAAAVTLAGCGQMAASVSTETAAEASTNDGQSAKQETVSNAPEINIVDIWRKYDKDPDKRTPTYDGKKETATGVIIYIGKDDHGTDSMQLSDKKGGRSYVLGVFGSADEMSPVSVGDTVTITGNFHIMSSHNMVVLKECKIINSQKAGSQADASDTVTLGRYQNQKIEWNVLTEKNGRTLLLATHAIDSRPFSTKASQWDKSSIRKWLNGNFYKKAFGNNERKKIKQVSLKNGDDLNYGTKAGKNTKDRVFLLSASEADKYLTKDMRTVSPTDYAAKRGAYTNADGNCAWWLRSPGMDADGPAYYSSAGDIGTRAHKGSENIIGVRPAIWVSSDAIK